MAVDPETRAYLDDMRLEMNRRFDAVDQRFDAVDQRFEAVGRRFEAVGRQFDSIDRRFVELDSELRRHFGVLIEQARHDNQTIAEMVVANTEAIADLRARLDAR